MLIRSADLFEVPVSRLLGEKIEPEDNRDFNNQINMLVILDERIDILLQEDRKKDVRCSGNWGWWKAILENVFRPL